ncbi:MAG: bis(5'-nucleosyl)-tetraphosphatase (symmetrical) [gamma proteobacterium symbiont of Ctena orbiculata]|uniref:Bis(5'-nucleosyl)-tetraphosphatase, symmetrical n=1 Tax=Candidatus Thiodiazotropha taylori TaxID=2792791 RepID=A0A944M5L3_9GAMM|nr:symmetrical bis(5'-nucleosyl)-tetraphosphatase [Candidatus Thiodiazotropha taylori]PUB82638.1 MAG: diadenosine tetraphosphatase [gamma proteobacterium symbiont of Ctena orbiculata]MBT2987584.1 symmetrical bis(5'-nucleosyl)-tetraphosphatase [Candidatus Thiodiazotropha taylori]MBT2995160.1 symmetrical bis(5'-nucleosyl)-tetraphosphatase [Candidatus Thiodiazotropha taylori]MBT2999921.1 symmetrical bis(5'-nucleosyl)-tetraphosphatase [Candidatus Thiodiazotropha taylori]
MSIYAIGDVQGCYDELQRLLEAIRFDPSKDKLWFAGDLVNRGPKSLQVLRFVKSLGSRAVSVLGNHDLHLLALSQGNRSHNKYGSLKEIIEAPDSHELIEWLRHRPMMIHHRKRGYSLVHAGVAPQWDLDTAIACAHELEEVLRGPKFAKFCKVIYGDLPDLWSESLEGMERLRFITNCFTRLRYCTPDGRISLLDKGPPGTQTNGSIPWFEAPGRLTRGDRILFGHWSTLGYHQNANVCCLDSGCLWGGKLTALRLRKHKPPKPYQVACQVRG